MSNKHFCVLFLIFPLIFTSLISIPTVDGLFYGVGSEDDDGIADYLDYTLFNENVDGRGKIYYYETSETLYVAIIVDPSVNDNVFEENTGPDTYVGTVGWEQHHIGTALIQSDQVSIVLNCSGQTYDWIQDYLSKPAGGPHDYDHTVKDWASLAIGNTPANIVSKSSLQWNMNYSSWVNTFTTTDCREWKSPYEESSPDAVPENNGVAGDPTLSGYPGYTSTYDWEWSMVYEMGIPMTSLCGSVESMEVISAHNSPSKDGEEDVPIPQKDMGDAPDSYHTLMASNGAYHHLIENGPFLGVIVDADFEGQPGSLTNGDDNLGIDDEDGVTFIDPWFPGATATVRIVNSSFGYITGWADFNGNGNWDDPGELIITYEALAGTHDLEVPIPADAVGGITYARFRISTSSEIISTGLLPDGEVEDYRVEIIQVLGSIGDYVWEDLNPDGVQEIFEPGIDGLSVSLYTDINQPAIANQQTGSGGFYLFTDLPAGTYYVGFTLPIGPFWKFTGQYFGNDESVDSNAEVVTGFSGPIILAAGEHDLTIDAGMYDSDPLPVTLSSFTVAYQSSNATQQATLQWTTQSESENSHWNIYRGLNGESNSSLQVNVSGITGAGTTSLPTDYYYTDAGLESIISTLNLDEVNIWYWLESVDNSGATELFGPVMISFQLQDDDPDTPELIDKFGIVSNYPNPFNPETAITFSTKTDGIGSLTIYNIKGEVVKHIFQNRTLLGKEMYSITWNGKDSNSSVVGSGIYLIVLKTDNEFLVKKAILQK